MTISGWIVFGIFAFGIIFAAAIIAYMADKPLTKCISAVAGIVLIFILYSGMHWYFTSTASGRRAVVDQQSELNNGLSRTITVYTADGNVLAEYEGNIDIESNDGGYVIFDYDGKRYMYYNCFVESIADIGG